MQKFALYRFIVTKEFAENKSTKSLHGADPVITGEGFNFADVSEGGLNE